MSNNSVEIQSDELANSSYTLDLSYLGLTDEKIESFLREVKEENSIDEMGWYGIYVDKITAIELDGNELTKIPNDITIFVNLFDLSLSANKIKELSPVLNQMTKLTHLNLQGNEIKDFSVLKEHPQVKSSNDPFYLDLGIYVSFNTKLTKRYLTKCQEWQPGWIFDESINMQSIICKELGSEFILRELGAKKIDDWNTSDGITRYTLYKVTTVSDVPKYIFCVYFRQSSQNRLFPANVPILHNLCDVEIVKWIES